MLDKLISVAKERDWRETERLLYEHWSQQCPLIFAPNAIAPWDVKVDEAKISVHFDVSFYVVLFPA